MSLPPEANSSKGKRQVLDRKITKFLPFLCLQTAFEYQQCWSIHICIMNVLWRMAECDQSQSNKSAKYHSFPPSSSLIWYDASLRPRWVAKWVPEPHCNRRKSSIGLKGILSACNVKLRQYTVVQVGIYIVTSLWLLLMKNSIAWDLNPCSLTHRY